MGKTILIIGNDNNLDVMLKITKEVNDFLATDYTFKDLELVPNIKYIKAIEGKVDVTMVNDYRDFFNYTNLASTKKVGIFQNFDLVSVQNQNKLLKMIEDNHEGDLQIFVTASSNAILTTIKSRMLIIDLLSEDSLKVPSSLDGLSDVIKTQVEVDYLKEEQRHYDALVKIYEHLKQKQYDQAYILFSRDVFKRADRVVIGLMYKMMLTALLENNQIAQAKKLIPLEKRLYANCDRNLQIEAMLIELSKE